MRLNPVGKNLAKAVESQPVKISHIKNTNPVMGSLSQRQATIIQDNLFPKIQYISGLVVRKKNLILEVNGINQYTYSIVAFFNTDKAATVIYTNYKGFRDSEYRVVNKYVKKIPFNTDFSLENCETVYEERLDVE
jgi:hypothetical protein